MGAPAFTPGPWTAEAASRGAWIKGANGECSALSCGNSNERADANARLIAAAPDLYEALVALAEELEGANRDSPQSMRMSIPGWAKMARAALAKVEGTAA